LTALGEQRCRSPEEFKAWSQNLGHNQVLTTLTSYGVVAADRQAAIVRGLVGKDRSHEKMVEEVAAFLAKYRVQS
jgi:hypothetical protein